MLPGQEAAVLALGEGVVYISPALCCHYFNNSFIEIELTYCNIHSSKASSSVVSSYTQRGLGQDCLGKWEPQEVWVDC